jgi:hypothetical protein
MKSPEFLRVKNLQAKCRLVCLLFLSFITIAGYGVNANGLNQQAFTVELLYSTEGCSANKTAFFGEYFPLANKANSHFRKYSLFTLFTHNRLVKVKLNNFSKRINPILTPARYIPIKTIPQNFGEHSFFSFTS